MASTPRQQIASPQIFTSDPIEQIYAKGTLDPDMGGLAYAFLNAARGNRADDQSTYMKGLHEANVMSSKLAAMDIDSDVTKELIKSMAEQANAGIDPSTIVGGNRIYKNPADPLTGQPSALSRDLKASAAAKNRAEAANAGAAHAPSYTVQQTLNADGTPGSVVITGKGPDPRGTLSTVQGMTMAPPPGTPPPPGGGTATNPNASIRPDGTVGPVSIPDARARASAANASGQQQRANEAKARAEANRTQQQLQQVK